MEHITFSEMTLIDYLYENFIFPDISDIARKLEVPPELVKFLQEYLDSKMPELERDTGLANYQTQYEERMIGFNNLDNL